MKNSIQLTIAILLLATVAFATDPADSEKGETKVVPQEMGVFKLIYKTTESTDVNVKILNENGRVIYEDQMKANSSFSRPYNLKNYGSGSYVFQVSDKFGQTEQVVSYDRSRSITLSKIGESNKVRLAIAAPGRDLLVNIYNKYGELIHQDHLITGSKGIQRVYDLSKRRTGDTKIEVVSGFEVVEELTI